MGAFSYCKIVSCEFVPMDIDSPRSLFTVDEEYIIQTLKSMSLLRYVTSSCRHGYCCHYVASVRVTIFKLDKRIRR